MFGDGQPPTVPKSLPSCYPSSRNDENIRKSSRQHSVLDRGVGGSNPLAPTNSSRNSRNSAGRVTRVFIWATVWKPSARCFRFSLHAESFGISRLRRSRLVHPANFSEQSATLDATRGPSVRRLVRDGVDTPLANLFVTAARPIPPEAEGTKRARSASEAFLYRRLESLPETRGRFQMNADLPIAFDGWGRMEIDLLCADSRLVVEVDGAQHLADPVAYRRDRRKDQLLQENGHLVLRYLAEDLAKELDSVLDGILRSLSARRNRAPWPFRGPLCGGAASERCPSASRGALASAGGHGTPR